MPVALRDVQPLAMPAFVVAGNHAGRGLEDLAHRAAAFLCFPEAAAELIREPGMLGPVMPAVGLVVGLAVLGNPVDHIIFGRSHGDCSHGSSLC